MAEPKNHGQTLKNQRIDFNSAFGSRLTQAMEGVFPDRSRRREFVREFSERCGKNSTETFGRWLAGQNAPDLVTLSMLLADLQQASKIRYDANFLVSGSILEPENTTREFQNVRSCLEEIKDDVHKIVNYLRDHELGLEGVLMRQTLRMLEDLHSSSLPQLPNRIDPNDEPRAAGFLGDDLLEIVESCATRVRLVTLRLDYVVSQKNEDGSSAADSDPEENATTHEDAFSARLRTLVAKNIDRGCEYEYILPGNPTKWGDWISLYRAQIGKIVSSGPKIDEFLKFRTTTLPLGAGFVLFDLDLPKLKKRRKMLYGELMESYILPDPNGNIELGFMGEVIPPSERTHGCLVMDRPRLSLALDAWRTYRADSEPA